MDEFKEKSFTAEGRRLRPRKGTEEHESYGSRPYDERRKSYGSRPYGERREGYREGSFSGPRQPRDNNRHDFKRNSYGSRPSSASSHEEGYRKDYRSDERRSNFRSEHREGFRDERREGFRSEHRSDFRSTEHRSDFRNTEHKDDFRSEHRDGFKGERRNFSGPRPQSRGRFGEHRSFGQGQAPQSRGGFQRKPFGQKPYGQKPFARRDDYRFNDNNETVNQMMAKVPDFNNSDNDQVPTPIKEVERLNKYIANSGVCSRREADQFIQAGIVTVNGEVVTELGTKVNVLNDDIRFNGERLKGEEKVYIVMNKPKGYVTTASDPHAERTVMDLLRDCTSRVFPVGRLDKNTTGVLMFTNDGDIAEKLTHPSYDKKKIYQVILDRSLTQEDHDKIMAGIELSDGIIAADELEYIDDNDHRKLGIKIHSGRNRIVRRIFESLTYDVRALDRVYFAGLTKKGLQKGEWRYLTQGEINILKIGAYM